MRVEEPEFGGVRKALRFWCPGCMGFHVVIVKLDHDEVGETYDWNGNYDEPTIVPTVRVGDMCSVSIRDGYAFYGPACRHELRGKKVLLPSVVSMA